VGCDVVLFDAGTLKSSEKSTEGAIVARRVGYRRMKAQLLSEVVYRKSLSGSKVLVLLSSFGNLGREILWVFLSISTRGYMQTPVTASLVR
jgi:hypothetical protein